MDEELDEELEQNSSKNENRRGGGHTDRHAYIHTSSRRLVRDDLSVPQACFSFSSRVCTSATAALPSCRAACRAASAFVSCSSYPLGTQQQDGLFKTFPHGHIDRFA